MDEYAKLNQSDNSHLNVVEEQRLIVFEHNNIYFQLAVVHKPRIKEHAYSMTIYLPKPISAVLGRRHEGDPAGYSSFEEAIADGIRRAEVLIDGI